MGQHKQCLYEKKIRVRLQTDIDKNLIIFFSFFLYKQLDDLRAKVNSLRKHKVTNSDERTEFENLTDFLTYLSEKYDSKTKAKTKTIGLYNTLKNINLLIIKFNK